FTSVSGGTTRILNLTPVTAALPIGTYHATVRVNAPGALNTPLTISVTLNVVQTFVAAVGTGAAKTSVVEMGASLPAMTILVGGQAQPASGVTFTSRATSVVTVDATGRI